MNMFCIVQCSNLGLESEFGSAPVSESGNVTKPVINSKSHFFGGATDTHILDF